ncbi:MAG: SspB family protein [Alphaproteobacteria bacterium]
MARDFIGYDALVEGALRGVVREALRKVEKQGLIGGHHFFITFKTCAAGVEMPDFLREQHPGEITIVVQNKFWGLKAGDEAFEVTLTFQKVPATLRVPYAAVTVFTDPATKFGLQFGQRPGQQQAAAAKPGEAAPAAAPETAERTESQVVSLDKFRKK